MYVRVRWGEGGVCVHPWGDCPCLWEGVSVCVCVCPRGVCLQGGYVCVCVRPPNPSCLPLKGEPPGRKSANRPRGDKGVVFDGLHDVIKLDLSGPRPAVVDDGLPVGPVPAVH